MTTRSQKTSSAKRLKDGLPAVKRHPPRKAIPISVVEGDTPDKAGERLGVELSAPALAAFRVMAAAEGKSAIGELIDTPGLLAVLRTRAGAVNGGDLAHAEAMLIGQADALQTLFVRLIERGLSQEWMPQFETHIRLAFKAQAQCRASLETLATLRNGPPIFARQANVAAGAPMQVNNGQAIGTSTTAPLEAPLPPLPLAPPLTATAKEPD
jgi:hypothetical protein